MLNPGLALLRFLHISEPATQTFILAFMIGAAWSWVSWSGAKSGCVWKAFHHIAVKAGYTAPAPPHLTPGVQAFTSLPPLPGPNFLLFLKPSKIDFELYSAHAILFFARCFLNNELCFGYLKNNLAQREGI